MDEIGLNKAVTDGKRASILLEDEMLQAAFRQLEHDYTLYWKNTKIEDTIAREHLWQAIQIVGKVRDHLAHIFTNGKVAQRHLDELAHQRKRTNLRIV